jgi:Domain of unknown function (DUF243)
MAPDEAINGANAPSGAAPAGPTQKHYKIIFIKAPSYGQQLAQQQAAIAAAQAEEKTLVYVLSKKPDDLVADSVTSEAGPAFTPSRPEVYFIKYKSSSGEASANDFISNAVASGGSVAAPVTGAETATASNDHSANAGGVGDFNLPQYPSVYGVPR